MRFGVGGLGRWGGLMEVRCDHIAWSLFHQTKVKTFKLLYFQMWKSVGIPFFLNNTSRPFFWDCMQLFHILIVFLRQSGKQNSVYFLQSTVNVPFLVAMP